MVLLLILGVTKPYPCRREPQIDTDKDHSRPRFSIARICSPGSNPKQSEASPKSRPQNPCLSVSICGCMELLRLSRHQSTRVGPSARAKRPRSISIRNSENGILRPIAVPAVPWGYPGTTLDLPWYPRKVSAPPRNRTEPAAVRRFCPTAASTHLMARPGTRFNGGELRAFRN